MQARRERFAIACGGLTWYNVVGLTEVGLD